MHQNSRMFTESEKILLNKNLIMESNPVLDDKVLYSTNDSFSSLLSTESSKDNLEIQPIT